MSIRPELEPLPDRLKTLAVDERGYPVPWFVAYLDGKPEFRAMDPIKYSRAIRERLCWVCGGKLGKNVVFVAGPMCGINRTSAEPPSHLECAQWSARNCPFLRNPEQVRRQDDLVNNAKLVEEAAGHALSRNPGVTMLWVTREFEVFDDGKGRPLITMGEPERVEWVAHGRAATRAEVEESIETGLPALRAAARTEAGWLEELERYTKRFEKWLPAQ